MGGAQNPQPTAGGIGVLDQAANPAAMEAALSIIDREEAASGRKFDPAFRANVLTRLASKSPEEIAAIRNGLGGGFETSFLGSNTVDFVYTPVPPCRIIDTRNVGGAIPATGARAFYATGTDFSSQGGLAGSCGIPYGPAKAVVINFVAVGGVSNGNLAVTPYGNAFPTSSIINWTAGVNIANGLPVAICNTNLTSCPFDINVKANVSAIHVVADVLGYFAAPVATSLDVQVVTTPYYSCPAGFNCEVYQLCNPGYTITGGGCQLAFYSIGWVWANGGPFQGIPGGLINGWNCQGTNLLTGAQSMRTFAMCSRVPGR